MPSGEPCARRAARRRILCLASRLVLFWCRDFLSATPFLSPHRLSFLVPFATFAPALAVASRLGGVLWLAYIIYIIYGHFFVCFLSLLRLYYSKR